MVAALQNGPYNPCMPGMLGYHLVKTCYGQWLPGDERGHWSTAWDAKNGHNAPHTLHEGDPVRQRMAKQRMTHPAVALDTSMAHCIAETLGDLIATSEGGLRIGAAAIEPTHMHLLLAATGRDIQRTARWLADQTTKAVHRETGHTGPVWAKGKWVACIDEPAYWQNVKAYIQRHNLRWGLHADPYDWITTISW